MADIITEAVQIVDTNGEKNNAAGRVEGERTATGVDAEGENNYEMGENEGFHVQGIIFSTVSFLYFNFLCNHIKIPCKMLLGGKNIILCCFTDSN